MLKIQRILCPIDFSGFSSKAYDYAESLARHYGAKLFLEHVVRPVTEPYAYWMYPGGVVYISSGLRASAEKQLQEFLKTHAHNGTPTERVVREGVATESILSFAEEQRMDLIVMGTHGRQGFDHLRMGSVTEKVLRKARCPVLAVRKPAHDFVSPAEKRNDPVKLRKILFCTDFSEHSDRALEYALSLAMEYNAELTLLNVLEDAPPSKDLQSTTAEVVRRLEAPVPKDARDWCTIKSMLRIGRPYQEIIQLALEAQTDLVIMGVRGRNALDLAVFGSTTHRVIQLGSCPVLAVHI